MDNDPAQQITQRLAELPEDVRNAIQSADLHQKIIAIGTKHKLHIDQVGELEDEVMLAMLGFSPLETLGARLATALALPAETGSLIAADVGAEVFATIRESMKSFAASRGVTVPVAPSAPAAVTPPASPKAMQDTSPLPSVASAKEGDMHEANVVLTQKTASIAPPAAPQSSPAGTTPNPIYKTDPYREPI